MRYCPISDFWSFCALQVNRVVFRSFLELQGRRSGKLAATSRRANVVTSQLATSDQQKKKSRSDPTSQRSFDFCFRIIKSTGRPNFVFLSKNVQTECGERGSSNPRDRRDSVFVFLFSNLFMIYRTMIVIQICSRIISRVFLNPISVIWIKA